MSKTTKKKKKKCSRCKGWGFRSTYVGNSRILPWHQIECEDCDGTGWVKDD